MLKLSNITKKYGDLVVYDNFNISFNMGETTAIMGKSGIGKTTLLNIISGLVDYSGNIENNGKISYVFQEPRLIETMTVKQNLTFVLNGDKRCKEQIEKEVLKMLEYGEISDKKDCYPNELSAGQKQRVSLIRAFLYPSEIMLMDEPFSSLDISLKVKIMKLYKDLLSKNPRTVIFVSHDIDETLMIADRVVVIDKNCVLMDEKIPRNNDEINFSDERHFEIRKNIFDCLSR